MFTLSSPPSFRLGHNAYSSPLAPRSTNIQSQSPFMEKTPGERVSSPPTPPFTPPSKVNNPTAVVWSDFQPSKRQTDPRFPQRRLQSRNPLLRTVDARQQQHRDKYLKDLQGKREERRFAQRGDQMLQLDWLKQQREWEAAQAREAPLFEQGVDADMDQNASSLEQNHGQPNSSFNMTLTQTDQSFPALGDQGHHQQYRSSEQPPLYDSNQHNPNPNHPEGDVSMESEVEALLRAEQEEMDALIAMHEEQRVPSSPVYGTEDDELDAALAGLGNGAKGTNDSMDMS